jgi:hypothetical protein
MTTNNPPSGDPFVVLDIGLAAGITLMRLILSSQHWKSDLLHIHPADNVWTGQDSTYEQRRERHHPTRGGYP